MKTVFTDVYDIAHLWAHELQSEAKNPSRNFYFEGDTIYSYGAHFPCGKIIRNANGAKAYILNTDTYSSTTAKHMGTVRGAIPGYERMFETSGCDSPHTRQKGKRTYNAGYNSAITYLLDQLVNINNLMEKQRKARSHDYRSEILSVISNMIRWIEFWNLAQPSQWYDWDHKKRDFTIQKEQPAIDYLLKIQNIVILSEFPHQNNNHKRIATLQRLLADMVEVGLFNGLKTGFVQNKETQVDELMAKFYNESVEDVSSRIQQAERFYKKHIARIARAAIQKCKESLEKWHKHETFSWGPNSEFLKVYGWHTALRLYNDTIETSKGIRISLEEGKRLWKVIQQFEKKGDFKRDLALDINGHKWAFNSYTNHILTAGCHQIPYSECKRIAELMNW
jgi:hypothetical protein